MIETPERLARRRLHHREEETDGDGSQEANGITPGDDHPTNGSIIEQDEPEAEPSDEACQPHRVDYANFPPGDGGVLHASSLLWDKANEREFQDHRPRGTNPCLWRALQVPNSHQPVGAAVQFFLAVRY